MTVGETATREGTPSHERRVIIRTVNLKKHYVKKSDP